MSTKLNIARIIYESDDLTIEQKLNLIREIRSIKEVSAHPEIIGKIMHLKKLLLNPETSEVAKHGIKKQIMQFSAMLG